MCHTLFRFEKNIVDDRGFGEGAKPHPSPPVNYAYEAQLLTHLLTYSHQFTIRYYMLF